MQCEACARKAQSRLQRPQLSCKAEDVRLVTRPCRHLRKSAGHRRQLLQNLDKDETLILERRRPKCHSSHTPAASLLQDSQHWHDHELVGTQQNVHDSSQAEHSGHSHSHCHAHGPRNKVLEKVLRATGILQLAELLEEKVWVSVTICALLAMAASLNWMSSKFPPLFLHLHPSNMSLRNLLPVLACLCCLAYFKVLVGDPTTAVGSVSNCRDVVQAAVGGIYALAGIPELVELLFNVANGHLDTHVLMTLACLGTLAIGSGFEGALLLVLFNVSHTVEHVLADKAQGSLGALFDQIPQKAVLVDLDSAGSPDIAAAREVATSGVPIGSTVLVRPGQQIPLDGIIVYGEALVSTEHLTGEALPVRKGRDDEILAGALNHDGLLVVRSSSASSESTPARIAKLTEAARARKPQLDRWLDKFGEVYVRCVLGITALSFLVLILRGVPALSSATQRGAVYRSIGLLTTASPCALVLVPLAYVAALACITKRGVLIRGTHVLDALAQSSTIAFDKTGTLTTGHLSCSGIHTLQPSNDRSAPALVQHAVGGGSPETRSAVASMVALSQRSNHPVSQAVAALGEELQLPQVDISNFKAVPGSGVQGNLERNGSQRHVRFGAAKYATEVLGAGARDRVATNAQDLASESVVSVFVDVADGRDQNGAHAQGDEIVRLFTFTDEVQTTSKAAVQQLQDGTWRRGRSGSGFSTAMLTGDGKAGATRIANLLGIKNVQAGLSPEQKLHHIEEARNTAASGVGTGGIVMVGDGINDAPALAAADVGIALASSPTEAASSAADVVILRGDGISALPFVLRVAHQTRRVVKQNLLLALSAILALSLPVLSGSIPLWIAVALHEGSTLLVALNSLRLLYLKDDLIDSSNAKVRMNLNGSSLRSPRGKVVEQKNDRGDHNGVIALATA